MSRLRAPRQNGLYKSNTQNSIKYAEHRDAIDIKNILFFWIVLFLFMINNAKVKFYGTITRCLAQAKAGTKIITQAEKQLAKTADNVYFHYVFIL